MRSMYGPASHEPVRTCMAYTAGALATVGLIVGATQPIQKVPALFYLREQISPWLRLDLAAHSLGHFTLACALRASGLVRAWTAFGVSAVASAVVEALQATALAPGRQAMADDIVVGVLGAAIGAIFGTFRLSRAWQQDACEREPITMNDGEITTIGV
jgi:VanZ family protein